MTLNANDFYKDLKYFLTDVLLNERLGASAENTRSSLLQRLHALRLVEPVSSPQPMVADDVYNEVGDDFETDFYEEFPDIKAGTISHASSESDCNSESSPASTLPAEAMTAATLQVTASKHGPLYRKDRFMFMDQFRRCWGAVASQYLFLFNSEKDSKPIFILLLHNYEARSMPQVSKEIKKKGVYFELISPGRKTFQYLASTQKDMQQWVTAINMEAGNGDASPSGATPTLEKQTMLRKLPSIPPEDEYSDAIGVSAVQEDFDSIKSDAYVPMQGEVDDLYYDINEYQSNDAELAISLPERPKLQKQQLVEEVDYDDIATVTEDYYNINLAAQVPPPPSVVSLGARPKAAALRHAPPTPPQKEEEEDFYNDISEDVEEPDAKAQHTPAQAIGSAKQQTASSPSGNHSSQSNVAKLCQVLKPVPPSQGSKPTSKLNTTKVLPTTFKFPNVAEGKKVKQPIVPPPQSMKPNLITNKQQESETPNRNYALNKWREKAEVQLPVAEAKKTFTKAQSPNVPVWVNPSTRFQKPLPNTKHNGLSNPKNTEAVKKPEIVNRNSGNIKSLIKQMEGALGKSVLNNPTPKDPTEADDLYEPINDECPQLPPRPRPT